MYCAFRTKLHDELKFQGLLTRIANLIQFNCVVDRLILSERVGTNHIFRERKKRWNPVSSQTSQRALGGSFQDPFCKAGSHDSIVIQLVESLAMSLSTGFVTGKFIGEKSFVHARGI